MIQVLVYAGGIVVLYLFVVMLVNLKRPPETHSGSAAPDAARIRAVRRGARRARGRSSFYGIARGEPPLTAAMSRTPAGLLGNTEQVGWLLYTDYLIPFEVASMLLLVAMIGAIILAKREPRRR